MKKSKYIFTMLFTLTLFQNCTPAFESNLVQNSELIEDLSNNNSDDSSTDVAPNPEPRTNPNPKVTHYTQKYDGLRPLTKIELESSLLKFFPKTIVDKNNWVQNEREPFDNITNRNAYDDKKVARSEGTARNLAVAIIEEEQVLNRLVNSNKNNPDNYLNAFVDKMIPIIFRGQFNNNDLSDYKKFAHDEYQKNKSLSKTTEQLLTALFLDPSFLYRNEEGTVSKDRQYRLSDIEYLNKMTFFLTGSGPNSNVINLVKNGYFKNNKNVDSYIDDLLASKEFLENIVKFHTDWFGIYGLKDSRNSFVNSSYLESRKLIEKIIYQDNSSWYDILLSESTFVNNELAKSYGIPLVVNDKWRWVKHKEKNRTGILGHASYLSLGVDDGVSNPIQRGYHIQKTFFCGSIDAPPKNIDLDMKPPPITNGRNCKVDRIKANTLENAACTSCHVFMEALGFGLENYDSFGRYITHEKEDKNCEIDTPGVANTPDRITGQLKQLGQFTSPEGLSNILVKSGEVGLCLSQKLVEYDLGQKIDRNSPLVVKLNNFFATNTSLKSLLKYYVMLSEYRLRKEH